MNKVYETEARERWGDTIAANHYMKLSVNADACLHCGHCESRCPFSVKVAGCTNLTAEEGLQLYKILYKILLKEGEK